MDCEALLNELQQKSALLVTQQAAVTVAYNEMQAAIQAYYDATQAVNQTQDEINYLNYLIETYCQGA